MTRNLHAQRVEHALVRAASRLISMLGPALALLMSAALTTAQTPAAKPPAGNTQAGRKLFVADGCYQCHGYEAQGGVTGPRLGPNPISFAALSKYVRQPTGQMPPYTAKVLSDKDLADIYAFLQSIAKPPDAKSIPLLNN